MSLPYTMRAALRSEKALPWWTLFFSCFFLMGYAPHNHPEADSFEAIDLDITSLVITPTQIFLYGRKKKWFLTTPYHPELNTRLSRFGSMTDAQRHPIPEEIRQIQLMTHWRDTLILIDPKTLTLHALDQNYNFISTGTLAWDTIKPAADPQGEAPISEARLLKKNFRKALRASPRNRIAGIWPMDYENATPDSHPRFMVATKIKNYPFAIMECDPYTLTRCHLTRVCEVDFTGSQEHWSGLGFQAPNLWYVFDTKTQNILKFHKESCFHMTYEGNMQLPQGYRRMQHMTSDTQGSFWFSASERDPYNNSNIFFWPSSETFSKPSQN